MRETFPVLLGTLVSQTVMNILALVLLGGDHRLAPPTSSTPAPRTFSCLASRRCCCSSRCCWRPVLVRGNGRVGRVARVIATIRSALIRSARACTVFRDPRRGAFAASSQLGAWFLQLLACWALFAALGLDHRGPHRRRRGGAVRGQRDRGRAGDPVEHRDLPAGRDQRAHQAASASRPPTRSPTASSCRRSRSRPPSPSAFRRWSARASPGRTCACAPSPPPRSASPPAQEARARRGPGPHRLTQGDALSSLSSLSQNPSTISAIRSRHLDLWAVADPLQGLRAGVGGPPAGRGRRR